LEEKKHLRRLVLKAKLKWDRFLVEMDANKKAITRLMHVLTNLQTLQLQPGRIHFTHTPSAQITSPHYQYGGKAYPNRNALMPSKFSTPLLRHQASLDELVVYAQPHQHISQQHPVQGIMK
jgi:hypothetical protein